MKNSQKNLIKLYEFIKSFLSSRGYPPTVREMASHLNIKSTSTIAYYLNKLEEEGKIKKNPFKNRALEVIEEKEDKPASIPSPTPAQRFNVASINSNFTAIPMLGTITAGAPILAVQEHDEVYNIPTALFAGEELFMLRVKGDSMINVGILDGDKIIVKKQSDAKNGDIVAALFEEETTVKTFYKEKDYFRLQPENDAMEPMYFKELNILGKVVGLIRKM